MRRIRDGKHLTPHQFANGWINANTDDGRSVVVKPHEVVLGDEDVAMFVATRGSRSVGSFWSEWELLDDGSFRALKDRATRRGARRGRR